VLVQNLAPGTAARLGLDAAALRRRYPRLIVCNISGYGTSGPYAAKKAYDLLVQAEVGLTAITGTPETPSRVGISVADIAAGMYAFSGVLTALLARTSTGEGTTLDVSLFDALSEWMSFPAYYTAYTGQALPRSGPNHVSIAPYGPFRTADAQVFLAVQNAREWNRFCTDVLQLPEVTDDPSFRTNQLRTANREALHAIINQVLRELPTDTLVDRLERAAIAYSRMNSVAEFLDHPQLITRGRWQEIESEAGPVRALKPPVLIDGINPVMGRVPALGEHTRAILEELGFDRPTLDRWKQEHFV
jgi:crotonobetainyl-CoA:carnitine CoA-transferase CaiB-like acyl-CoA transferase